ncbi:hypothetical protein DH2020_028873 [Rehmannia glutinosa]|uniref:Uncharacterized protein n=1 Tax=Rehmannia glutinosa TaxID=99300 RepID=A0ABR0VSY8_REHGL
MGSQAHLDKMQLRQNYRNLWHTDLMRTIQNDPPCSSIGTANSYVLYVHLMYILLHVRAFLQEMIGPCVSYMLRKRALYNDMSRYVCAVLDICLAVVGVVKVVALSFALRLSTGLALSHSKFLFLLALWYNFSLYWISFDPKIGFHVLPPTNCLHFSLVAMIVGSEELSEASQILSCLSDMVYCSVCACMQTQHKIEMDKRDGKFGPQPAMAVPAAQQMSRIDQPYPLLLDILLLHMGNHNILLLSLLVIHRLDTPLLVIPHLDTPLLAIHLLVIRGDFPCFDVSYHK